MGPDITQGHKAYKKYATSTTVLVLYDTKEQHG
jgi:hypothetical protein